MEVFAITKEETIYYKAIAIMLVLLGHLGFVLRGGAFGVNIFLVLSGYGCMESLDSYLVNGFWKKKVRIYFIYLVFIAIQLIYMWLFTTEIIQEKLLKTVVSLAGLDLGHNVDPTMWYISFFYLYLLAFWIFMKITYKVKNNFWKRLIIILFTFAFSVVVFCFSRDYHLIFHQNSSAFEYTFSFCFGMILSFIGKYRINKILAYILYVIGILSTLVIGILYYGISGGKYIMFYDFFVAVLFILLAGIHFSPLKREFKFIGIISFEVYLVEGFFLRVCQGWMLEGKMRGIVAIILSLLVGGLLHYVLSELINLRNVILEGKNR